VETRAIDLPDVGDDDANRWPFIRVALEHMLDDGAQPVDPVAQVDQVRG
jgi:hypothetical protein